MTLTSNVLRISASVRLSMFLTHMTPALFTCGEGDSALHLCRDTTLCASPCGWLGPRRTLRIPPQGKTTRSSARDTHCCHTRRCFTDNPMGTGSERTTMSTSPTSARTLLAASLTCCALVTSHVYARALPPAAVTSAATSSISSCAMEGRKKETEGRQGRNLGSRPRPLRCCPTPKFAHVYEPDSSTERHVVPIRLVFACHTQLGAGAHCVDFSTGFCQAGSHFQKTEHVMKHAVLCQTKESNKR